MPVAVNLSNPETRREAVQRLVESLAGGGIARFRGAEGDWGLASAADPDATARLQNVSGTQRSALLVVDDGAARDFVPKLPRSASRLLRRGGCPVILRIPGADLVLLGNVSAASRKLSQSQGYVHLAPPAGEVTRSLTRQLPGPLLARALDGSDSSGVQYDTDVADSNITTPVSPAVITYDDDDWSLSHTGSLGPGEISRMMAEKIVFVCTGNTCRSPMAEVMLRQLLAERLECAPEDVIDRGFAVASAGLAAMVGAPAAPEAVQICDQHGLDLRSHASQPLTPELLQRADRVYTMTVGHREAILERYPEMAQRVQILSRTGEDVTDPIGWGMAAYEQSCAEITENLRLLVDELTGSKADGES